MKFSPNNRHLLSVSRDRKWALFERSSSNLTLESADEFNIIASTNKQNGVHGRIIWTCDWSHDSTLFATGSRDGKCAIWQFGGNVIDASLGGYSCADVLEIKDSITAISFGKSYLKRTPGNYLIAVGCESGSISVCSFTNNNWKQLSTLNASNAHHLAVRKLEFKPNDEENKSDAEDDRHTLASCGNDNYVRIHELTF